MASHEQKSGKCGNKCVRVNRHTLRCRPLSDFAMLILRRSERPSQKEKRRQTLCWRNEATPNSNSLPAHLSTGGGNERIK
eukprot:8610939-Pyramimonas_sp.AAC.1